MSIPCLLCDIHKICVCWRETTQSQQHPQRKFVVTPEADEVFIRAPRFIGRNADGSEIEEDQSDPIVVPTSLELPDGGESIESGDY